MSATMVSMISHIPLSESRRVQRERTFALVSKRPDFQDVIAQYVILLTQLHSERFTGQLTINLSQGSPNNIKLVDSHEIS